MVRADGIGDALCLAPLVCALRDEGHELGALMTTRNAEAFVDGTFAHVHRVERIPWPQHGSSPDSYKIARAQARIVGYDVALVCSEEPEAYRFAREIRAPVRVGFTNGIEKPFKGLWARRQLTRGVVRSASPWRVRDHEVETLFRLGDGLHAEGGPTRDLERLRPLVASAPRGDPRVAVQIVPRALAPEACVAIVRAVAERYSTVLFGPSDETAVAAIAAETGVAFQTFARVRAWCEALGRVRALVTPDSGAAHLAGIAGVPCVDLFPVRRHVVHDMLRWAPWASPSRTLILGPEPSVNARAVMSALYELLEDDSTSGPPRGIAP